MPLSSDTTDTLMSLAPLNEPVREQTKEAIASKEIRIK